MEKIRALLRELENNKEVLPGADETARNEFYADLQQEVQQLSKRTPEDRRQASMIAVDASKTFVQISVAVLVALGAFAQYGLTHGWGVIPLGLLALAGMATFWSMQHGMRTISAAYKRGDGRDATDQEPWSTLALKRFLGPQGKWGLIALGLFALAIVASFFWSSPFGQGFKVTLPEGTEHSSPATTLTMTGQWTELSLTHGETTLAVPDVPEGEEKSIKIEDE